MTGGILEAFTVIKAINEAKDIVGQFVDLVSRYVQLPERVNVLHHQLRGCECALNSWKNVWGVEKHQSFGYYKCMWGENGWQEVQSVVATLLVIFRNVNNEIKGLVDCVTRRARRPLPPNAPFDEKIVKEGVKRIQKRLGWWLRFKYSIKQQASKMESQIREFNSELRALRRISIYWAELHHGQIFSRHGRIKMEVRRKAIMESEPSTSRTLRQRANELHEAFETNRNVSCMVGLTTITVKNAQSKRDETSTPDPDRDFQMLIKGDGATQEVLVVHVVDRGKRHQGYRNFTDAFRQLSRNAGEPTSKSELEFVRLSTASTREDSGYRMYRTSDAGLENLARQDCLADQLYRWNSKRDRIQIAYTLAQGYMRLLGTPWLEYVECDHIHARLLGGDSWAGMLDARPSGEDITEALEQTKQNFQHQRLKLTQHAQIYRLGIVLVEIAKQDSIEGVKVIDGSGLRIVLQDDALDPDRVARSAEDSMIDGYRAVVYFCLSVFENEERRAVADLTEDFVAEVLIP